MSTIMRNKLASFFKGKSDTPKVCGPAGRREPNELLTLSNEPNVRINPNQISSIVTLNERTCIIVMSSGAQYKANPKEVSRWYGEVL